VSSRAFPTRLYLFALAGWTFDFYDLVLLGFLKEAVGRDLHLSAEAESWMLGVALSTSGLGGIISGFFADRYGKRTVLSVTILLYSLGSLLSGLAPSFGLFLVARGVVGLGVGGEWAIGHGMLAEAVASERRGRASAALQAGEPLGVMLAAAVGFLVMPMVGWRWVLIGSSVTAILALAARRSVHLPDEPSHERVTISDLRRAKVGRLLLVAWVLGVLKLGTYWTCYTWLPSFLKNEMHQPVARSFAWVVTAQVGQLVGMLVFGSLADRSGRRLAFTAFSLLTAAALAPLAFAYGWLAEHPLAFWGAMLGLGLGSGCTAGFGALLAELFPTEVRAAAMGATYNLARAAQVGAPILVLHAVRVGGLAGGLGVPMVLALGTASWVWMLPETRGIALPSLALSLPSTTAR
jgi:MFS family permease